MHFSYADMLEEGPDEEDQAEGYFKGDNEKLYWIGEKANDISFLYDPRIEDFRRMTFSEKAEFYRTTFLPVTVF